MTWFKIDDKLHSHPKWRRLPKGARALWTTAGSWSSDQSTNGKVPQEMLKSLDGTASEARALVDVGLWESCEDGWIIHDFLKYNPSSETVQARRASNAQRLAAWRRQKKEEEELKRDV